MFSGDVSDQYFSLMKTILQATESNREFDVNIIYYKAKTGTGAAGGFYSGETEYEVIGEWHF